MKNKLNNQEVFKALQEVFGASILKEEETIDNYLTVLVEANSLHDMISWLYNHDSFKVQFLTNIAGVHYPDKENDKKLMLVYHLHSLVNNFRVRLKAYLPIDNPSVKSITDIFAAADWIERETYDFYGIKFNNHPNLKRILNEDSMDYFPLRKEYQLEDATRQDKDNSFFGR